MQDGAKSHTAGESIELLDRIAPDRIQNHPPQSPDLNMIEDIWSHMDREIRKIKKIKDLKDLESKLRDIWNEIPLETIRASVASLPRRLTECLTLRGERTSY